MHKKISFVFDNFAKLATVIFICSSVYIAVFFKMSSILSVSYIWGVLSISLVCSIMRLPFYREKEMGKKTLVAANIIYFLLTNLITLSVGFQLEWFSIKNMSMIVGMEITIICVTVIVWTIMYISDKHSAEKMNDVLKKMQNK